MSTRQRPACASEAWYTRGNVQMTHLGDELEVGRQMRATQSARENPALQLLLVYSAHRQLPLSIPLEHPYATVSNLRPLSTTPAVLTLSDDLQIIRALIFHWVGLLHCNFHTLVPQVPGKWLTINTDTHVWNKMPTPVMYRKSHGHHADHTKTLHCTQPHCIANLFKRSSQCANAPGGSFLHIGYNLDLMPAPQVK